MEGNDFRQNFQQNLHTPAVMPVNKGDNGKLPLVIAIILAVVVLFESVALFIVTSNYFGTFEADGDSEEIIYEESSEENFYEEDLETIDNNNEANENITGNGEG